MHTTNSSLQTRELASGENEVSIYLTCGRSQETHIRNIASPSAHAGASEEISTAWADHALSNLGRGATSVADLQQSAAAIVAESNGHVSSTTHGIARIGCSGKYPNNAERDLFRLLDLPTVPELNCIVLCGRV